MAEEGGKLHPFWPFAPLRVLKNGVRYAHIFFEAPSAWVLGCREKNRGRASQVGAGEAENGNVLGWWLKGVPSEFGF